MVSKLVKSGFTLAEATMIRNIIGETAHEYNEALSDANYTKAQKAHEQSVVDSPKIERQPTKAALHTYVEDLMNAPSITDKNGNEISRKQFAMNLQDYLRSFTANFDQSDWIK